MSWDFLLSLLALFTLLALVVQLLRFLWADGDLTLLWAEWQGRRPEWELTDMVVWVTGASSGIGEELAYQLSKLGVSLVLSARREQELERVKRRCLDHFFGHLPVILQKSFFHFVDGTNSPEMNVLPWTVPCGGCPAENGNLKGKDVLVLPLDLTDISSHEAATKTVLQEFGKIDILVNNGGRSQRSLCVETSLDVYKELITLNYLGTVSLTKCVLPHMIKRNQGKIITVNSFVGIVSGPLTSGYCASKHALRGFFSSLRAELVEYRGIVVSNLYPGPVQSDAVMNALSHDVTQSVGSDPDMPNKMATSRCVRLMLVSMANDLKEVWIGEQPFLLMVYLWQYMPTWGMWLMNRLGKKIIENFKGGLGTFSHFTTWKIKNN